MRAEDPIETEIMRMNDREMEARAKGFCFASGRKLGKSFAARAEEFRVERAKAWSEFLEISAEAGYAIEDNLANRSLFMGGYESGKEAVVSRLGGETSHLHSGNVPIQSGGNMEEVKECVECGQESFTISPLDPCDGFCWSCKKLLTIKVVLCECAIRQPGLSTCPRCRRPYHKDGSAFSGRYA